MRRSPVTSRLSDNAILGATVPDLQTALAIPVSTTPEIPGRTLASYVGPAFGLIVRSTGAGGNLKGTFKGFKQGEVVEFSASLEEARHVALERLVDHAIAQGANAVVGLRFDSTDMGASQGMAEILAYGTGVVLA